MSRPSAKRVDAGAAPLAAALTSLAALARRHDRPDLAEAADGGVRRLESVALRIVVIGEFKKGKSSLINALLDAPVAAVDDDIATAARLEIGFADPPGARWWRWVRDEAGRETVADRPIPIAEAGKASTLTQTTLVRAGLPRRLLRAGLIVVDTPGVGGISSAGAVVTSSSLADADVVLFVSDCSQELTAPELRAVADAVERGPTVVVVETKADLSPHWRSIVDADREHLAARGVDVPVLAVSSELRRRALATDDRGLNAESGFPQIVDLIAQRFLPEARSITQAGALRTARRVYALLHQPLVAELRALEGRDDDARPATIAAARADVEGFKERASAWQQQLNDGSTDLAAAVDHDLRERFRRLVRECEEELDDVDPDEVWDEFEPALYRRVAEELDANMSLLRDRASDLAQRLADQLADAVPGGGGDPFVDAFAEGELVAGSAERKAADTVSSGARVHQAFRAGYGGAMPIMALGGMALGVLGLGTMVLPLAAVAGVVASRKALRDDRERQLTQRRQQAKVAAKKYCDDTLMRAGNERKAQQRRVQRTLRDHFTTRVKELAGSYGATLRAAEASQQASAAERRQRLAAVRDEIGRIEAVATRLTTETSAETTPDAAPSHPPAARPPTAQEPVAS